MTVSSKEAQYCENINLLVLGFDLSQIMAKLQPCSVGIRLNKESDCHKLTYNRSCKLNTLGLYSVQPISLIHCRTELNLTNVDTIWVGLNIAPKGNIAPN